MKKTHNICFSTPLVALLCLSACTKSEYSYSFSEYPPVPGAGMATKYVNETFDDVAKVDGQMLQPPSGWTSFAVSGMRTFQTGVLATKAGGVMRGVMGTGYLSSDTVNDFWLMMPPLDVSDSTGRLTFQAGLTYDNASTTLTLMYSATYNGGKDSLNLSEWKELLTIRPKSTISGAVEITQHAPISLWGLGGSREVAYVAFRYRSKVSIESIAADNANRSSYYLDNVVFRRN
jgi:hypothetical protein